MKYSTMMVLGAVSLSAAACLIPAGMAGMGTIKAENPVVSGQALENRSKADTGTVSESDCTTWPFEDVTRVTATPQEICVSVVKHKTASSTWSGEPTSDRTEGVSIGSSTSQEGAYINATKKRAAKVGECFNRGFNEQIKIWVFEYQGCTPNTDLLTEETTTFSAYSNIWEFPAKEPAAAEPAAAPPAS